MPFLRTNLKRVTPQSRRLKDAKRRRLIEREESLSIASTPRMSPQLTPLLTPQWSPNMTPGISRQSSPMPDPITSIEDLPREVLELIFAYAGNLDFPQASHVLASKLSRTPFLEKVWLQGLVSNEMLPSTVLQHPFVTRQLLNQVEFTRFEGNTFVPLAVEKRMINGEVQALDLVLCLIGKGCHLQSSSRCYLYFVARHDWESVKLLANTMHSTTCETVSAALRAHQPIEVIARLIDLVRDTHNNRELTSVAVRVGNSAAYDYLIKRELSNEFEA